MIFGLDEKFDKYDCAREVSPDTPDDLLKEFKAFYSRKNEKTGKDYLTFRDRDKQSILHSKVFFQNHKM